MVSGIGQSQANVYPRSSAPAPPKDVDRGLRSTGADRGERGEDPVFFNREPRDVVRVGFGDGTISEQTVLIRTIRKGMDSARRVVPTIAQLRDDLRASVSEQRETNAKAAKEKAQDPRTVQVGFPNAVDQARGLVNALDQAASTAQARLAGTPAPTTEKSATVQVNGQTLPYLRNQAEPNAASPASRLDLRA